MGAASPSEAAQALAGVGLPCRAPAGLKRTHQSRSKELSRHGALFPAFAQGVACEASVQNAALSLRLEQISKGARISTLEAFCEPGDKWAEL